MHSPKYALFYDNHTMPQCPDVGHGFDVEHFTGRVKNCGVDYLTFHARCNLGMSYYDTDIGIRHPSLKYDLFGQLAESCQQKGIALTAYLNAGISSAEGLAHPEWCRIDPDGRIYAENKVDPYVRTMCFNSGYHEHLVSMVVEIAEKYNVAGFFLDCFSSQFCVCKNCIKEMKRLGYDWQDHKSLKKFGQFSAERLAKDIAEVARKINPEYLFYFNGLGYEEQLGIGSYLECECLPTAPCWGYYFLPLAARHMRTIGQQPLLNMTARFYDWADFGGIRSAEALKYELLTGLALGLRPNIGSHFHPRGDFEEPVFELAEKVYGYLQEREEWYDNAEGIAEIAIVFTKDNNAYFSTRKYLRSATRMLGELQLQFDVITEAANWDKYKLLVLPDEVILNDSLVERLKKHIAQGGAVISSGHSGLDVSKNEFGLKKEWGLHFNGDCQYEPAYCKVDKAFAPEIVDMPLSMYSPAIDMEALPGTEVVATVFKPYYNKIWDGEYAFFYTPPDKDTGMPALTFNGKVAHFSHKIFGGYYDRGAIELRSIFDYAVKRLLPNPVIKTENLPKFARAIMTRQVSKKRTMVHILAYVPELRGETEIIEDAVTLLNVKIYVHTGNKPVRKVYLAPENKELMIEKEGEYISVNIPEFTGYALVVFEN